MESCATMLALSQLIIAPQPRITGRFQSIAINKLIRATCVRPVSPNVAPTVTKTTVPFATLDTRSKHPFIGGYHVAATSREMETVHGLEMDILSSILPRRRRERMCRYPSGLRFCDVYEWSVSGVSVSSSSEKRRKRKFESNVG